MDIESFIKKVENMRALQKNCYKYCNQALLKKIVLFEKEVDREIRAYNKDKAKERQNILF